jgi:Abortive infection alpha
MSNEDPITESAKAAQEIAKTTGKAIDATQKFGGFVSQYIAGTLEQGMGIFEDKLKYYRWERQVRFMKRSEDLMREVGLDRPRRQIPLKLAIPLLEAASLEDDDFLQDLWAKLLVNAANNECKVSLQRAYISILEQLTSLEAHMLLKIYSLTYDATLHKGIITGTLPNYAVICVNENDDGSLPEPSKDVKLALSNLARLGCIRIEPTWNGDEYFHKIQPTILGKSFFEACTLAIVENKL